MAVPARAATLSGEHSRFDSAGDCAVSLRTADRTCYRCDRPLDGEHWIRLSAENRGERATAFVDVSWALCADCAAGIGMLEFAERTGDETGTDRASLRDRFTSIR